jgi:hypothetical protein
MTLMDDSGPRDYWVSLLEGDEPAPYGITKGHCLSPLLSSSSSAQGWLSVCVGDNHEPHFDDSLLENTSGHDNIDCTGIRDDIEVDPPPDLLRVETQPDSTPYLEPCAMDAPKAVRDTNLCSMLDAAVPMRLYVRGPSPAAMARIDSFVSRDRQGAARSKRLGSSAKPKRRKIAPHCDDTTGAGGAQSGIDPNLLHAPPTMIDSEAYRRGRSTYIAMQYDALVAHHDRGMRLLSRVILSSSSSPSSPSLSEDVLMDLSRVLDIYKHRLAVAHYESLRRRVVALSALYDHTMRGTCVPPEAVMRAASVPADIEMAAAWYTRWGTTVVVPLHALVYGDGDDSGLDRNIFRDGAQLSLDNMHITARPLMWVPVAGNTGVPLAAGAPLFYVGTMPDPLSCPVHCDADGHLTCPPVGCAHRDLLANIANAIEGDLFALDALLVDLVSADAGTVEFALRLRSTVNAALDYARIRWGNQMRADVEREPVDLFSECPVDAFVLVRVAADGALLPHVIAVAPRFDIELCM